MISLRNNKIFAVSFNTKGLHRTAVWGTAPALFNSKINTLNDWRVLTCEEISPRMFHKIVSWDTDWLTEVSTTDWVSAEAHTTVHTQHVPAVNPPLPPAQHHREPCRPVSTPYLPHARLNIPVPSPQIWVHTQIWGNCFNIGSWAKTHANWKLGCGGRGRTRCFSCV